MRQLRQDLREVGILLVDVAREARVSKPMVTRVFAGTARSQYVVAVAERLLETRRRRLSVKLIPRQA